MRYSTFRTGRRLLSALSLCAVAACGGGSEGSLPSPTAARASATATAAVTAPAAAKTPACDYESLYLTVESVRLRLHGASGEAWHEMRLPQPRQLDLLHVGTGLLEALGAAPLPAGRYKEVRLVLAGDPMANVIQASGGAPLPLSVPGGLQDGLRVAGGFEVPASQSGDIMLDGFDACKSVVKAGSSGTYQLKPSDFGRAVLLDAAAEQRINGDQIHALPGAGIATSMLDQTGATVQRYSPDGSFAGAAIRIASPAHPTSLTPLAGGDFLLTWQLPPTEGPGLPVQPNRFFLQRYDASGMPVAAPSEIGLVYPIWFSHTFPGTTPTTAASADGGFALLWRDICCHYLLRGEGRATPGPVTTLNLTSPARVVALTSGGYLVVAGLATISATAFGVDGGAVGPAQAVGATGWTGPSTWTGFDVSGLADGGAVVAWATEVGLFSGATPTLNVRRVDGTGAPGGASVNVGPVDQGPPAVTGLPGGGFVLAWLFQGHVYAMRFAADGSAIGAARRLDAITSSPSEVSVVANGAEGFIVSWSGLGPDRQRARYGRFLTVSDFTP